MKLLFSTAPFFRRPVREAFLHAAAAGFTGVEVMVTHDPDTQDPVSLYAAAAEFDLTVEAIHAPFLVLTRRVWSPDPIAKVGRAAAMAEDLGCPIVVAHPPYRWQSGYSSWLAEELPALSEASGVTVAVENVSPVRPWGIVRVPHLHEPEMDVHPHVTLDTSHAAIAGWDIVGTAVAFAGRLSHVHLSNNAGKGWDSHLPVDEGVLPLRDLLTHLEDAGFDGAISIELDLRRWVDDPAELNRVLVRNREFCESPLSVAAQ